MSTTAACWIGSRRPDRAEVDEAERPVVEGEHVARVRIGVEEARRCITWSIVGAQELPGEPGAVDAARPSSLGVGEP